MRKAIPEHPTAARGWIDHVLLPLAIVLTVGGMIAATGATWNLTRPLWFDEIMTAVIVRDPDVVHSMQAMAHAVDTNVPGLHLITRVFTRLVGGHGGWEMRLVSLGAAILGLIGIYAQVRRLYTRLVALAATAVAWSHPILVNEAFNARYYALWFGLIVWYAYALNWADRAPRKLGPRALVGTLAILVCVTHYFGVVSLGLVTLAHVAAVRRPPRETVVRLLATAPGPLALAACLPTFYVQQRASLSVPTWIAPPTLDEIKEYFYITYVFYIFTVVMAGFFMSLVAPRWLGGVDGSIDDEGRVNELAGLASLLAIPAVMIVFSVLVQPVQLPRYAATVAAAFAAISAPVLARSGRPYQVLALVVLLAASAAALSQSISTFRAYGALRQESEELVRGLPDGTPVLFRSIHDLYTCAWQEPERAKSWALWDTGEVKERPTPYEMVEHDMTRAMRRWYGLPGSGTVAALAEKGPVYLIGPLAEDIERIKARFPRLALEPVDTERRLYRIATRP